MRDYADIINRLKSGDREVMAEAAEAMEELCTLARRMTALGVDLEAQIQEDMTPDVYSAGMNGLTFMMKREDLKSLWGTVPDNVPFTLKAIKVIGDSWFVFHEEDGIDAMPREYYTEEAAQQSIPQSVKEKDVTYT